MNRKLYNGLDVEVISFGDNMISATAVPNSAGCTPGTITLYTEDAQGVVMKLGECWYESIKDVIIKWKNNTGHTEELGYN